MARVTQEFPPLLWICFVWGNETKHFILFSLLSGFKCPICSKSVASDEMEMHFIMCLSKPRLSYNGEGLVGVGGGLWAASASCLSAGRARGVGQGGSPSGGSASRPFFYLLSSSRVWSGDRPWSPTAESRGSMGAPALCGEGESGLSFAQPA